MKSQSETAHVKWRCIVDGVGHGQVLNWYACEPSHSPSPPCHQRPPPPAAAHLDRQVGSIIQEVVLCQGPVARGLHHHLASLALPHQLLALVYHVLVAALEPAGVGGG